MMSSQDIFHYRIFLFGVPRAPALSTAGGISYVRSGKWSRIFHLPDQRKLQNGNDSAPQIHAPQPQQRRREMLKIVLRKFISIII